MFAPTPGRAAAAALGAALALALAAGPAAAAGHHAAGHRPTRHRATAAKATVRGVVTHRAGNRLTVLAHDVTVGARTTHHRVTTLVLAAPARGHRAVAAAAAATGPQVGDTVTATGSTTDGSTVTSTVVINTAPTPARALLGVVSSVNGSLVTLTRGEGADRDHDGRDTAGSVVVDTSAAGFTGAAATAAALTPGQYVVVLGEEDQGDFAAAQVVSYADAPQVLLGRVAAADATARTLAVTPHEAEEEDGGTGAVSVDASAADVVVNGNDAQQASAYPGVGDRVLVVAAAAPAAGAPMAADVVFAFNAADHRGAGHNDDGDDAQGHDGQRPGGDQPDGTDD